MAQFVEKHAADGTLQLKQSRWTNCRGLRADSLTAWTQANRRRLRIV
ncbi:hypothetical protein EVA_06143 [gut metagenome]|uniref:Uncharacterized protein n=1 Tax=gut metagenome TaxID=749906 RepID=J9GST7_9ZZZZ